MSDDTHRGRFVWYDLMTTDPEAAQAFYTELIGWGTQQWDNEKMPYTMWTRGEEPLGGVMQLSAEAQDAGAPPHWLGYTAVTDVDASVAQAQELGATVYVPGTDIPGAGRFALLADPQGASFAVYASAEPPAAEAPATVGQFSWHELMSGDYQAGFDFYSQLFGWEKQDAMDMGEGNMYQMYGRPGSFPLGGMYNKPADWQGPPAAWLFYISVDDVRTAVEKLQELGGQLLNGPMEVPGGDLVAQCLDPQGGAFALHSSGNKSGA